MAFIVFKEKMQFLVNITLLVFKRTGKYKVTQHVIKKCNKKQHVTAQSPSDYKDIKKTVLWS